MKKIIFIHRGRNNKSKEIGRLFTSSDYNFDYRGKNKIMLLLKAFITSLEIPSADIYFVEGGLCMDVAYFKKLFNPKSKVILMVPEPLFDFDHKSVISKIWIKHMIKKADGIIAISQIVKEDAKKIYKGPIEIAPHFIENIERFKDMKIDLNSKKIVYVCERPNETGYIKGLDIAIKAFEIIKNKIKDAELLLVGSGTENLNFKIKGIKYLGYKDVAKVYDSCLILIAPSRYDAFNMAVAEASCAGIIPLVSSKTGAKEFLPKELIANTQDPKDYAKAIIKVFNMDKSKLENIIKKNKNEAMRYSKDNSLKAYKKAWRKLVKDEKIQCK